MGGPVVDRAFAQGLSREDGVRTYVALAAPHSGATEAIAAQAVMAGAGDGAALLRSIVARHAHDPDSDAIRELARLAPPRPPIGVTRLDVRLASDYIVLSGDTFAPGVDTRAFVPRDLGAVFEGHGGVLRDERALALTRATIATGRVPSDDRSLELKLAAHRMDVVVTTGVVVLCLCVGAAALVFARAAGARGPARLRR